MKKPTRLQKGSSSVLIIIITVVATALIVGGGVFYWQERRGEKPGELARPEVSPLVPVPTDFPTMTPLATSASPSGSVSTPTPDPYSDWSIYTNDPYNYQFQYPPGATVTEVDQSAFSLSPEEVDAGMTFEEKFTEYTGKVCLTINHGLGYVQISAPPNESFVHVLCGRTGRAYEGPDRTESLTIDGDSFTAAGFEEQGPGETLNYHNETLVVTLSDGTRIEYGSRPEETATFADYQEMRGEIVKIVESFEKI